MRCDDKDSQDCPKSKDDHGHCQCWWDGDGCCWCKTPAMTEAQMREQGMEVDKKWDKEMGIKRRKGKSNDR